MLCPASEGHAIPLAANAPYSHSAGIDAGSTGDADLHHSGDCTVRTNRGLGAAISECCVAGVLVALSACGGRAAPPSGAATVRAAGGGQEGTSERDTADDG